MIHTVKGFGIVNKAEIDVFLELSCFFHDPANVVNLISGSSAFSKTTNQNHNEMPLSTGEMVIIKKMDNSKCCRGSGVSELSHTSGRNVK